MALMFTTICLRYDRSSIFARVFHVNQLNKFFVYIPVSIFFILSCNIHVNLV